MSKRGAVCLLSLCLWGSASLVARADDGDQVSTDVKRLDRDVNREAVKDTRAVKREAVKQARDVEKEARAARRSFNKAAHRIDEAACTGTDAECDTMRARHRVEEAKERASDRAANHQP